MLLLVNASQATYVLYARDVMESAELRGSHTVWKACPGLSDALIGVRSKEVSLCLQVTGSRDEIEAQARCMHCCAPWTQLCTTLSSKKDLLMHADMSRAMMLSMRSACRHCSVPPSITWRLD